MDYAALHVNIGIFVATAGAAAVAWRQAILADRASAEARQTQIAALHRLAGVGNGVNASE